MWALQPSPRPDPAPWQTTRCCADAPVYRVDCSAYLLPSLLLSSVAAPGMPAAGAAIVAWAWTVVFLWLAMAVLRFMESVGYMS